MVVLLGAEAANVIVLAAGADAGKVKATEADAIATRVIAAVYASISGLVTATTTARTTIAANGCVAARFRPEAAIGGAVFATVSTENEKSSGRLNDMNWPGLALVMRARPIWNLSSSP